jgi:uncharacterized tellurite resistance protein B-like protein
MVTPDIRRKFETLVAAAYVDGTLSDSEKAVLHQKASTLGIPQREVADILFLGQQRKLSVVVPSSSMERDSMLEDLIEIAAADGRIEAPEYHLLARFAETLKIPLPELRTRVNRRMQSRGETRVEPRREAVRDDKPRPQPPPAPKKPAPPPTAPPPPPPAPMFEQAKFSAEALPPMMPSGPTHTANTFAKEPKVADLPPVTLQLLKQSVMFDTESESIANIGRTLGVPPSEAAGIRSAILAAFPDIKPASGLASRPQRR